MNIQLLRKIAPALGLVVSLSTTSFAGYKIFAAPLEHQSQVPSLPDPTTTPENEPEEIVETVYVDEPGSTGTVAPTPKPTVSTGVTAKTSATVVSSTPFPVAPSVVRSSDDHDGDDDHDFEDDSDDKVTIKHEDESHENETPEPTEKPEDH